MRKRDYVSPTALKIWQTDPEAYYNQYLAEAKLPRELQTPAMSVGSAFDAFVKSYLHQEIYGANHKDSAIYDLDRIFEAQVEPQNRDAAREQGSYVFSAYKDSGALADLMYELDKAAAPPRFEMEIRGVVTYQGQQILQSKTMSYGEVILLGKPDIYFINGEGAHVVLDWKVNGFFGKGNTSPMAGFRLVRDCHFPTKNHGQSHKDYFPTKFKGMEIDAGSFLEQRNADWAAQLATYGWLLGEPVGAEIIVAIDQIVCSPLNTPAGCKFPYLRIAHHRTRVGRQFQINTIVQYQELWKRLNEPVKLSTGESVPWFFRELSPDQSWARCKQLDTMALALYGPEANLTDDERWLVESSRKVSSFYSPKKV